MSNSKLDTLRQAKNKQELASLLGVKTPALTYILYKLKPSTQYTSFNIPKKNGGLRTILSPSNKLKVLQSNLSHLLLDCIDEINKSNNRWERFDKENKPKTTPKRKDTLTLSHGFVRHKSIITNALMHTNQKNVLNIDLKDFFDSFNFGRVRGFFIKNNNFKLNPDIATIIAQIACCDNKLPQGSPCSPVITNLIAHSLDITLAALAKKHSCIYSRYADDMTFSTRKSVFPNQIMSQEENGEYLVGKKLTHEIMRAGFSINTKKTRIQYRDSRQDVTGLIVNKKPNVKKEYWRTVKSQCNLLFHTGAFIKKTRAGDINGNLNELEGQLNFIDQVDYFNRPRLKTPINYTYAIATRKLDALLILSGREKTFRKFLYYRLFYGNTQPTILCEGKTDNIYLKSAINILANKYQKLAIAKTKKVDYELLIHFVNYSRRSKFLIGLDLGGSGNLKHFMEKFHEHYEFYKAPNPQHPVIMVLDNDSGFTGGGIKGKLETDKFSSKTIHPESSKDDIRKADFIHVMHNFYIILTPLKPQGGDTDTDTDTDIEYFFDNKTRRKRYKGKCFNTVNKRDEEADLSKNAFSKQIIKAQKKSINFDRFEPLLDRIVMAIEHYDTIKDRPTVT